MPDRLGLSDVHRVAAVTDALKRQESALGGGACREAIVGYLNWATGLRHATMTDDVRRELNETLAYVEILAGWVSYDMLLFDAAEHFYLRALHSARLADHPLIAARALASLGESYLEEGQLGDAMRTFRLAAIPADEAGSARMTAWLHVLDAITHSLRGATTAVDRAVDHAQEDYAKVDNSEPFRQRRFLIDATLHNRTAMASSGLAQANPVHAARAIDAAAKAARCTNPGETRALLVDLIPLGLNAYRAGNAKLANDTTSRIVAALPQVSSRRLITRLRPLAAEATIHDSTATDLAHRLRTQLPPS